MEKNQPKKFEKTAHLFAHRKTGAQRRFEGVYKALREKVQAAWMADLLKIEAECQIISKSNGALAQTKLARAKSMAEQTAKETMRTVFDEWRTELNRIVADLNGYPQEDGMVLFPDGSTAKMPKGLFIPKELQL